MRQNNNKNNSGPHSSSSGSGSGKFPRHRDSERSRHYAPLTHHEFKKNQNDHQNRSQGHSAHPAHQGHRAPSEDLLKKLDRLMELYIQARRKYFEVYNKVEEKQRKNLERELYEHLRNYRRHENFLSKHHAYLLARKTVFYRSDLEYSAKHPEQQKIEPPPLAEDVVEDIHLLVSQKNREKYKEDQEESMGTMEDYYTLKGGRPSV